MKKAYTMTPAEYEAKRKEIDHIGYKNGWDDPKTGRYTLSERTNPKTRKHFENLTEECDKMPIPENDIFFRGTDIYNLWLNRNTDEPITARELYNIVVSISEAIEDAGDSASSGSGWENWDGR